jgi:hypothetical protein
MLLTIISMIPFDPARTAATFLFCKLVAALLRPQHNARSVSELNHARAESHLTRPLRALVL